MIITTIIRLPELNMLHPMLFILIYILTLVGSFDVIPLVIHLAIYTSFDVPLSVC